jgi:arylsulfatase A-like enzyme
VPRASRRLIVGLALALVGSAAAYSAASARNLPNIVFIMADDLGWGDIEAYRPDGRVPTPNLDRLCRQGMRFTDAHSPSTLCAPARYSAMTGNYPWRGRGTWRYNARPQLQHGQATVAQALKAAGYRTAFVGKLHLGGDFFRKGSEDVYRGGDWTVVDFGRKFGEGPTAHGFDHAYAVPDGIQGRLYAFFEDDLYAPLDPTKAAMRPWAKGTYGRSTIPKDGYGDPSWDSSRVGPILAGRVVQIIDRYHREDLAGGRRTPFFVYFATQAVHRPHTPPDALAGAPIAGSSGLGARADMVHELDVQVGLIVRALEERGLAEHTILIVTSDNGAVPSREEVAAGHDAVAGLRGRKGTIWEGGHRVPFVVKWGDGTGQGSVVVPGSVSTQLIGVQDWVATVYALIGRPVPPDQARDSVSFLPLLDGTADAETIGRTTMVVVSAGKGGGMVPVGQRNMSAIRVQEWKLILDAQERPVELYNLADNLGEDPARNLVAVPEQAARVADMTERYHEARRRPRTAPPFAAGS